MYFALSTCFSFKHPPPNRSEQMYGHIARIYQNSYPMDRSQLSDTFDTNMSAGIELISNFVFCVSVHSRKIWKFSTDI